MQDIMAFLSESVFPVVEQNGVVFSALVAAIAFAYKTRLEAKQSVRHALFLVMQVRITLSSHSEDVKGSLSNTVESLIGDLGGLGVPVDEESLQVNKDQAEQFGLALEERFFALDGASFADSIRNATRELSKSDPFMANKITFISKLPSVLESQQEYISSIEQLSAKLSDQSLPRYVVENTRAVCKRLIKEKNAAVVQEVISEVDSTLRELAQRSSWYHLYRIKRLMARWDSETPEGLVQPERDGLEETLRKITGEILILNRQHEQAAAASSNADQT
ncbi:hypothetical protein [Marinobacter nitratireducens]|uniref:hypothetical protein n=1 Tax=Marinobacter nitratireducens TaxID=1137280 RepID=UPI000564991C|nr:hypothetical protein [Marinobacter nitratireducens]